MRITCLLQYDSCHNLFNTSARWTKVTQIRNTVSFHILGIIRSMPPVIVYKEHGKHMTEPMPQMRADE